MEDLKMNVKELFEKATDGTLTYDQFSKLASENNVKLVDLNEGEYISKNKHLSELDAKAKEIENLNETIKTRDVDLESLKAQLTDAGTDSEKLKELSAQFEDLKGKYDDESKAWKKQLAAQAYEFAVKEFANTQKFTSEAAKRDFTRELIGANLKMEKEGILGANDFATAYKTNNPDAFVVDTPAPEPTPEPQPQIIVGTTPGVPATKPTSLSDMMKMANENPGMAINF